MATDPKALGNQPAVPHHQVEESETYSRTYAQHHGISKRELFAGLALAGLLARTGDTPKNLAEAALMSADALLAQLAGG